MIKPRSISCHLEIDCGSSAFLQPVDPVQELVLVNESENAKVRPLFAALVQENHRRNAFDGVLLPQVGDLFRRNLGQIGFEREDSASTTCGLENVLCSSSLHGKHHSAEKSIIA
jgi:hypothetical protein